MEWGPLSILCLPGTGSLPDLTPIHGTLLCARPGASCWGHSSEQDGPRPCPTGIVLGPPCKWGHFYSGSSTVRDSQEAEGGLPSRQGPRQAVWAGKAFGEGFPPIFCPDSPLQVDILGVVGRSPYPFKGPLARGQPCHFLPRPASLPVEPGSVLLVSLEFSFSLSSRKRGKTGDNGTWTFRCNLSALQGGRWEPGACRASGEGCV